MSDERLKDGTVILLREPTARDFDALVRFFRALSAEDRRYLRRDVADPAVVDQIIREVEQGTAARLVALQDDRIVGQAALVFQPTGWQRHMGELRVVVAAEHRRRGLGQLLVSATLRLARLRGLERVQVRFPAPLTHLRQLFERLGFRLDGVLEEHVMDRDGRLLDLTVMSVPLTEAPGDER